MSEIQAVIDQRSAQRVAEAFFLAYEERYGVQPMFEKTEDQSVFHWLVTKLGEDKAKDMVRMYVLMDGDKGYFASRGHTLKILRDNASVISANLGIKNRSKFAGKHGVWFLGHCDSCNEERKINSVANQVVGWTHICDDCKKNGVKPSKAEEEFISKDEWIRRVETKTNKEHVVEQDFKRFKRMFGQ